MILTWTSRNTSLCLRFSTRTTVERSTSDKCMSLSISLTMRRSWLMLKTETHQCYNSEVQILIMERKATAGLISQEQKGPTLRASHPIRKRVWSQAKVWESNWNQLLWKVCIIIITYEVHSSREESTHDRNDNRLIIIVDAGLITIWRDEFWKYSSHSIIIRWKETRLNVIS